MGGLFGAEAQSWSGQRSGGHGARANVIACALRTLTGDLNALRTHFAPIASTPPPALHLRCTCWPPVLWLAAWPMQGFLLRLWPSFGLSQRPLIIPFEQILSCRNPNGDIYAAVAMRSWSRLLSMIGKALRQSLRTPVRTSL